jgi:membrane protease YdiL (CAAX protease family)
VFLQVQGIDFELLAAGVAMLAVGIILISIWGFKKLIPEFDLQLEMKFIVDLLQLIGGIILSVVMLRLPVHSGNQEISVQPILVLMTTVLAGVIVGMFWYHFKIKRFSKNMRRVS